MFEQSERQVKTLGTPVNAGDLSADIYSPSENRSWQFLKTQAEAPEKPEAKEQRDILQGLLSLPKDKLSAGLSITADAAREFADSPDKKAALEKTTPKFQAGMEQSDKDFGKAMGDNWSTLLSARREVTTVQSLSMRENMDAAAKAKEIPEDKRRSVMGMSALLLDDAVPRETKEHLRGALKDYPGMLQSVDNLLKLKERGGKAQEAMEAAQKPLLDAAMSQAATRFVYAKALEQGKDIGSSLRVKQEGEEIWQRALSKITGAPMPEVKPALKV